MAHPEKSRKRMRQKVKLRTSERFGLDLSNYEVDCLISQIHDQKSIFVQRTSRRISHHIVTAQGKYLPVVYDKVRGGIVTVLPEHVLRKWLGKKNVREKLRQGA